MSATHRPSLALLSLNVNGLGSKAKRLTLFASLIDGPWDVVLLQETHHESAEQGLRWTKEGAGKERPWPGSSFWAEGTTASRGVAVLFKDKPDLADMVGSTPPAIEHDGRILRVDFQWQQMQLSVVNVYSPSTSADRAAFFREQLLHYLPQQGGILVGGDFNCVSTDLDVTANAAGRRRTGYLGGLQLVEETYSLRDAWREQHPGTREITHTCASDQSGARLDRWLLSTDLIHSAHSTDIYPGLPGDHLGVVVKIQAGPAASTRGPSPWTFPLELVDDADYSTELHGLIQRTLDERAVGPDLSHGQRWDDLKRDIRDHATEFARLGRLRQSAVIRSLRCRADRARATFIAHPTAAPAMLHWLQANRALQDHIHDRAQAAAVRAGVLWQHYGEQSTHYFYHLSRQRQHATIMSEVTDIWGQTAPLDTPEGRATAGQTLADFFSSDSPHGLFRPRSTAPAAQHEMLSALDKHLSEEAAAACESEGTITLDELTRSLHTFPRGKRPGSDGLPYEFLQQFWTVLGPVLLPVFLESFQEGNSLTPSQAHGLVTLLYKGSGPRSDPASYRPITLLNSDFKLLAKALTDRWGSHITSVVDDTQTAFLPGRDIASNVLAHLEEVEYLETAREPGCLAFLDFSKAYDRLDREWVLQCMRRIGFGPSATRWVDLLHSHLTAKVRFNGWLSPSFPVSTGLAQGSPLSPLLFVVAAQPLAAHLRRQAQLGVFQPISKPDGSQAPPSHQHADDTTLHVRTRWDLHVAVQTSIQPFCEASGSALNASKSRAMLLGGGDDHEGVDPDTGITFVRPGESHRHLGIRLSTDQAAAATETYTAILGAVRKVANHWVSRQLTQIGRVHVAKQVLASKVTYHATFIPVPAAQGRELASCLQGFVSGGRRCLRPSREVHALPWEQGGMRLVQLHDMTAALQAKLISRLFEPEKLVWKEYAAIHFSRSETWLQNHPHVPARAVDSLGYGVRIILTTRRTQDLGVESGRIRAYIQAYRRLRPHRLVPPASLTAAQIAAEPLFHNLQITEGGKPLVPTAELLTAARQGVTAVGDLISQAHALEPAALARMQQALPEQWRTANHTQQPASDWLQDIAGGGRIFYREQVEDVPPGGQQFLYTAYTLQADGRLSQLDSCPFLPLHDLLPVTVILWDPARPWRPGKRPVPSREAPYLLGPPAVSTVDPSLWGVGQRPCHQLVVKEASTRLTVLAAFGKRVLLSPLSPVVPAIWEGGGKSLAGLESKWTDRLISAAGRAQPAQPPALTRSAAQAFGPDYGAGAAWFTLHPSQREHWRSRQLEQAGQISQSTPPASQQQTDDLTDVAAQTSAEARPWSAVWTRLHHMGLDRQHRLVAWQVLHAALPCGAHTAYVQLSRLQPGQIQDTLDQAMCPHCLPERRPETLSHMLLDCPVATQIWTWVCHLWAAYSGTAMPPLTATVLLADDQREWQPASHSQAVWAQLRMASLTAIRNGASLRRKGLPITPVSIAATVVAAVTAAVSRDWQRVQAGSLASLSQGVCCSTWLRGRQPLISRQEFTVMWATHGVFCTVSDDGGHGELRHVFSLSTPVPFPVGGADAVAS